MKVPERRGVERELGTGMMRLRDSQILRRPLDVQKVVLKILQ